MLYQNLTFPKLKSRPYFFSNFVTTLDGKAQILKDTKKYWPLGSKTDYQTLLFLRTKADCLIHGKTTTLSLPNLENISSLYIVVSNNPDKALIEKFKTSPKNLKIILATSKNSLVEDLPENVQLLRLGKNTLDLKKLSENLFKRGVKTALVEGGPTLMGGFFSDDLIDEIFLTLTPKIVGGEKGLTLTMVEGQLLPADQVKKLELLSTEVVDSEIYLRYKVLH